jgi:L-lactate dehydrogenase complex protein LldE
MNPAESKPKVGLFVTCLVDLFRPSVGFASVKLLERAGCTVEVPIDQTCCGQPAHNAGDARGARAIARQVITIFERYDYTVIPSGSCGGMIKKHYPALFDDDPAMRQRAEALSARTFELVSFLTDVRGLSRIEAGFEGTITYHDSCSGLRELDVKAQPRRLLQSVSGLRIVEAADTEICCGFGGTFCVKYPEISDRMVADKVKVLRATNADMVLAGDMGCLLNIAGKMSRHGCGMRVRHVAEVLAGMTDDSAIGERVGED